MTVSQALGGLRHLRYLNPERLPFLRPRYPAVAVEINRREVVLVRLRRHRGKLTLEAHQHRALAEGTVGASIFRPNLKRPDEAAAKIREVFEATGTKPGRVSVLIPDNLAKISLLHLPESPPSPKQLGELIRFRLRRSVPFRMEDARMAYQIFPARSGGIQVLVALTLRSVLEQYEGVFEAVGASPVLVDLCTPNLYNLCRAELEEAVRGGQDAALLNLDPSYFSMMILQEGRLAFYRCKSYGAETESEEERDVVLRREINTSLSYYREKLEGRDIAALWVRSADRDPDDASGFLQRMGFENVRTVDPSRILDLPEGLQLDPRVAQRIAPAVGAAAGRGR